MSAERLDAILVEMREAISNGDWEGAHSDADKLLIATINVLAPSDPTVTAIVLAYDEVGKWYA